MTKVKVFVYGRRRRRQRRGYDNSSPDFRHGKLIKWSRQPIYVINVPFGYLKNNPARRVAKQEAKKATVAHLRTMNA